MSLTDPNTPTPQLAALLLAVQELLRTDAIGTRASSKFNEAMAGLQTAYASFGNQVQLQGAPLDDFELLLAGEGISPAAPPTIWPKSMDVGRYGDMSQLAHLRVGLDGDSDVYVSVYDGEGGAAVEFNMPFSGGGNSPRTREALIALMVAMEKDNAEEPTRDWWARSAQPAKEPRP